MDKLHPSKNHPQSQRNLIKSHNFHIRKSKQQIEQLINTHDYKLKQIEKGLKWHTNQQS